MSFYFEVILKFIEKNYPLFSIETIKIIVFVL